MRELMPRFVKTLRRWYWTVQKLAAKASGRGRVAGRLLVSRPETAWGGPERHAGQRGLRELGDGEHIALAVFEPGRLACWGGCNAIHRVKPRRVVLFEHHASAAQLSHLGLEVLHGPGGQLVLGRSRTLEANSRNKRSPSVWYSSASGTS